MKLTRNSTGVYYTEDRLYKIKPCSVRDYGWDIAKQRENGGYKIVGHADTLPEAREKVSQGRV